jgi:hypothetical protein
MPHDLPRGDVPEMVRALLQRPVRPLDLSWMFGSGKPPESPIASLQRWLQHTQSLRGQQEFKAALFERATLDEAAAMLVLLIEHAGVACARARSGEDARTALLRVGNLLEGSPGTERMVQNARNVACASDSAWAARALDGCRELASTLQENRQQLDRFLQGTEDRTKRPSPWSRLISWFHRRRQGGSAGGADTGAPLTTVDAIELAVTKGQGHVSMLRVNESLFVGARPPDVFAMMALLLSHSSAILVGATTLADAQRALLRVANILDGAPTTDDLVSFARDLAKTGDEDLVALCHQVALSMSRQATELAAAAKIVAKP